MPESTFPSPRKYLLSAGIISQSTNTFHRLQCSVSSKMFSIGGKYFRSFGKYAPNTPFWKPSFWENALLEHALLEKRPSGNRPWNTSLLERLLIWKDFPASGTSSVIPAFRVPFPQRKLRILPLMYGFQNNF